MCSRWRDEARRQYHTTAHSQKVVLTGKGWNAKTVYAFSRIVVYDGGSFAARAGRAQASIVPLPFSLDHDQIRSAHGPTILSFLLQRQCR